MGILPAANQNSPGHTRPLIGKKDACHPRRLSHNLISYMFSMHCAEDINCKLALPGASWRGLRVVLSNKKLPNN